jgi:HK97 family phage major capsid protein
MSKITELRDKRNGIWEQAKAFLDSHRAENQILSAEDNATYERMEKDVVALGHEIERYERQETIDRELAAPTQAPLTRKPGAEKESEVKNVGTKSEVYNKSFWNTLKLTPNRVTPELHNALQVGADSEGGYLVPDTYEYQLLEALGDYNIVRPVAHIFRTGPGDRKIPIVASKGTASWVDEEGLIPESDDSFGLLSLSAYKMGTMIKVSEELLVDSVFDLSSYFIREFSRRLGEKEEQAFLTGTGIGRPMGIFHATQGGEVGKTTASASTITIDELIDLYYSLKQAYRGRAMWMMNESTVKLIRKLKDGNGNYIWSPGIKEGEVDMLMGKRVLTSVNIDEVAAGASTIAFGDYSNYWVADRQGIIFRRLNELYATTGQVGFLATKRCDGRLIMREAVKILKMKAN